MRIAAISDLHGNAIALEAVLRAVEREKPDKVVVLGDLVAFGPAPGETLDRLRQIHHVSVIRGNTDRYLLEMDAPSDQPIWEAIWWTKHALNDEQTAYLASLQSTETIRADGVATLLCHADPVSDDGGFFPDKEEEFESKLALAEETFILCGHTHRPLWRKIGAQFLVNDGSAGFPYDGDPRPSFAICDLRAQRTPAIRLERIDYDTHAVAEQLAGIDLPMAKLMAKRVLVGKMLRP